MVITNCYRPIVETKTPFGEALKHYRKAEKNLTQPKLAKKLGVSQSMISDIEKGKKDGSAELREKIAEYFKIPYSDFLELGREKLQPDISLIEKTVRKVLDEGNQSNNIIDYQNPIKVKHYQKVNEFPDPVVALELNTLAVELAHIEPKAVKEVIDFIKFKIGGRTREHTAPSKNGTRGE